MTLRVLVVDDDGIMREVVQLLLHGLEVIAVPDAASALARLAEGHCDVVLTDQEMPSYTGLQLLLDVAGRYPEVRRVIMSALPSKMFEDHVASRLVHGVLTKPFERGEALVALFGVEPDGERP